MSVRWFSSPLLRFQTGRESAFLPLLLFTISQQGMRALRAFHLRLHLQFFHCQRTRVPPQTDLLHAFSSSSSSTRTSD